MLLEIVPEIDGGLVPSCTPSLMPFHISYSGPAPVSRYFRPKPAPPSLATLPLRSSSSATLVASSSSTSVLSETKSNLTAISSTTSIGSLARKTECGGNDSVAVTKSSVEVINRTATQLVMDSASEVDMETQPAVDTTPLDGSSGSTSPHTHASSHIERFVAGFRGRQMYGQAVDVPSGYGGLVLRAPLESGGKCKGHIDKGKPKPKTRAATRRWAADGREGEDDESDDDIEPSPPTKRLVPLSTFNSFMLWTPDRPLDEGRDEYARTLLEWARLATEIHSYDE